MSYFLTPMVLERLYQSIDSLFIKYQSADPFPHIVLDDVFDPNQLYFVSKNFPNTVDPSWWGYNNPLESKKYTKNDLTDCPLMTREFIYELMSNRFVSFLQKLTGINDLIVDHTLNGGGMHQIFPGGKLDIHADYNYHPGTHLDRRLNVLVYLNQDWKSEWGGHLELWNKDMTKCIESIVPFFNRMVIFSTTDTAHHGHPEPLLCPEGESRKSIALYYYTNGRPESEKSDPHLAQFKRRPQDPIIEEIERLRQTRAIPRDKKI